MVNVLPRGLMNSHTHLGEGVCAVGHFNARRVDSMPGGQPVLHHVGVLQLQLMLPAWPSQA